MIVVPVLPVFASAIAILLPVFTIAFSIVLPLLSPVVAINLGEAVVKCLLSLRSSDDPGIQFLPPCLTRISD
jgi:hypothetical protein